MSISADVSTLTTIPMTVLDNLFEKEQLCILHKFYENEHVGEPLTYVDLGFGTLYIQHIDNDLKYKFIPSKSFEKALITVSETKESPLIHKVESTLKEKILNTYKDLL